MDFIKGAVTCSCPTTSAKVAGGTSGRAPEPRSRDYVHGVTVPGRSWTEAALRGCGAGAGPEGPDRVARRGSAQQGDGNWPRCRPVGRQKTGTPRAPARARLSLLPSGPGEVHRVTPHGGSGTSVEETVRGIAERPATLPAMTHRRALVLPPPRS